MPEKKNIQNHPYYEKASRLCAENGPKFDIKYMCEFMQEWDKICFKLRRAAGLV